MSVLLHLNQLYQVNVWVANFWVCCHLAAFQMGQLVLIVRLEGVHLWQQPRPAEYRLSTAILIIQSSELLPWESLPSKKHHKHLPAQCSHLVHCSRHHPPILLSPNVNKVSLLNSLHAWNSTEHIDSWSICNAFEIRLRLERSEKKVRAFAQVPISRTGPAHNGPELGWGEMNFRNSFFSSPKAYKSKYQTAIKWLRRELVCA